jgi:hypothetical protein
MGPEKSMNKLRTALNDPLVKVIVAPLIIGLVVLFVPRLIEAKANVKGDFAYGELVLPPALGQEIRELRHALLEQRRSYFKKLMEMHREVVSAIHADGNSTASQAVSVLDKQSAELLEMAGLPSVSDPSAFRWIPLDWDDNAKEVPASYVQGTIRNDGKKIATGVRLELPRSKFAVIERAGGSREPIDATGVIEIGSLQPDSSVKVTVWSDGIGFSRLNELVIRSDAGVGSVTTSRSSGDPLGVWIPLFSLLVVSLALGGLTALWSEARKAWAPTTSKTPESAAGTSHSLP